MDITFENVTYTYQAQTPFEHTALKDVSMHIPSGKFVAIIGHTGSGKSTLIQHLNGLLTPSKGTVKIGPYTLTSSKKPDDLKELRSQVGVVFQYPEHQLFEETIAKDIAFGPMNFGVEEDEIQRRVQSTIRQVGLSEEFLERSPFELSGGQMRRVAIAGVLALEPKVLVLDEPTAGLDPQGQQEMMDMFYKMYQEQQLTTILVTHHMEDALKYADYVFILNKGTVYLEGPPEEVLTKQEALQKVQLDMPEIFSFLQRFEKTFNQSIPYRRETIKELAQRIKGCIEGMDQR